MGRQFSAEVGSSVQASPGNAICVRGSCIEMAARLWVFLYVCLYFWGVLLNPVKTPGSLFSRHLLSQSPQFSVLLHMLTFNK